MSYNSKRVNVKEHTALIITYRDMLWMTNDDLMRSPLMNRNRFHALKVTSKLNIQGRLNKININLSI